jgi:hypothetical protein
VEKVEKVEKAQRKLEKDSVALERSGKETTGWSVPVISFFQFSSFAKRQLCFFQFSLGFFNFLHFLRFWLSREQPASSSRPGLRSAPAGAGRSAPGGRKVEKVEKIEKAKRKLENNSVALERSGKETTGWSVPVISLFQIFQFCPKTMMLFLVFAWLFTLFPLFPVLAVTGAASQLKSARSAKCTGWSWPVSPRLPES